METTDTRNFTRETSVPLYEARGWMRFIGLLALLQGALTALSIVGLIIAWLPIWMGVLLFQAASAIEKAFVNEDRESFVRSLDKLKTFFTLVGAFFLLLLIATAVFYLFMLAGGIAGERWMAE